MKSSRGCLPNWICLQLAVCSSSLVLCVTIGKVCMCCRYNSIVWVVHHELFIVCCLCRPHTDTKLHSGCGCSCVHHGSVTAHTRRPGHKISHIPASHISPQTGVCICVRWVVNRAWRHVRFSGSLIWPNYHILPQADLKIFPHSTYYWSKDFIWYVWNWLNVHCQYYTTKSEGLCISSCCYQNLVKLISMLWLFFPFL